MSGELGLLLHTEVPLSELSQDRWSFSSGSPPRGWSVVRRDPDRLSAVHGDDEGKLSENLSEGKKQPNLSNPFSELDFIREVIHDFGYSLRCVWQSQKQSN